MRRLRIPAGLLCALAVALPAAAAETSAPAQPPHGKLMLGMVGPDPDGFDRLTGKHHVLHVIFGAFRRDVDELLAREHEAGRLPVLSLKSDVPPEDIARGAEDPWLVELATHVNASGIPVWIRPFPEMNGHWNSYAGFDENGRLRSPKHAPPSFVRAFRRVVVIMRGGPLAAINRRLASLELPPVKSPPADTRGIPSSRKVAIVWNPQGHGTPFIEANGPRAYWPGPGFVDYVASDLYSDSGEPSWRGMDALYDYGKPYLIAEWALEAEDDPAWAQRMFDWVAKHPRTVGLVYFDKGWSRGSGIYQLRTKPRSLAVYRRAIRHARFIEKLPG